MKLFIKPIKQGDYSSLEGLDAIAIADASEGVPRWHQPPAPNQQPTELKLMACVENGDRPGAKLLETFRAIGIPSATPEDSQYFATHSADLMIAFGLRVGIAEPYVLSSPPGRKGIMLGAVGMVAWIRKPPEGEGWLESEIDAGTPWPHILETLRATWYDPDNAPPAEYLQGRPPLIKDPNIEPSHVSAALVLLNQAIDMLRRAGFPVTTANFFAQRGLNRRVSIMLSIERLYEIGGGSSKELLDALRELPADNEHTFPGANAPREST